MQKGSLVVLKENPDVIGFLLTKILNGQRVPYYNVVYTLDSDPFEHFCVGCQENHTMISLEEMPGSMWDPEIFNEVQKPGEVDIKSFIEDLESIPV